MNPWGRLCSSLLTLTKQDFDLLIQYDLVSTMPSHLPLLFRDPTTSSEWAHVKGTLIVEYQKVGRQEVQWFYQKQIVWGSPPTTCTPYFWITSFPNKLVLNAIEHGLYLVIAPMSRTVPVPVTLKHSLICGMNGWVSGLSRMGLRKQAKTLPSSFVALVAFRRENYKIAQTSEGQGNQWPLKVAFLGFLS